MYLRGYATMNLSDLEKVARGMVAKGKGLLAADESSSTIKKRFDSIKLDSRRNIAAPTATCC